MKLFHTENGKEAVYVQMQDIMYLSNETDMPIPASIYTNVFNGVVIVNDSNRFNFLRFEEEHEIQFFKELDFILDYDKYKDLTDDQLEEEEKKLEIRGNEIAEKWNIMTEEERKEKKSLFDEYHYISYMLNFLSEIYTVKQKVNRLFSEFGNIPGKSEKKPFFRRKKDVE